MVVHREILGQTSSGQLEREMVACRLPCSSVARLRNWRRSLVGVLLPARVHRACRTLGPALAWWPWRAKKCPKRPTHTVQNLPHIPALDRSGMVR